MFRKEFVALTLFMLFIAFIASASASPSPVTYYLDLSLGVRILREIPGGAVQSDTLTIGAAYTTFSGSFPLIATYTYDSDPSKFTVAHLWLKAGETGGSYTIDWRLDDVTTGVKIAGGSFSVGLATGTYIFTTDAKTTTGTHVDKSDTIRFSIKCTAGPGGATYCTVQYGKDSASSADTYAAVPELIPEFALALPVVVSLGATAMLLRRKLQKA